jgi:DNA-nicking Smr family endonuclease
MSNDDARTFRTAMIGVTPLPAAKPAPSAPKPRASARFARARAVAPLWETERRLPGATGPEVGDGVACRRPGVRDDAMRRLQRGEVPIEAEIDLHGLARHAAHESLRLFLGTALAEGLRCVRVIHGKGLGSLNKEPVLKGKVRRWLAQKDEVIAFCQAGASDGGSGALLVLLKARA